MKIRWRNGIGSTTLMIIWVCICELYKIWTIFSSYKRKTKWKMYHSQLTYEHHCKLFGSWSLGVMEHFPLDATFGTNVQRYHLFTLDGVWPSSSRFTRSMGNHKSTNKIGFNTMVISIERTCLERKSHLEAFMFHCRWHSSQASCNQVQRTIYLPCPFCFV